MASHPVPDFLQPLLAPASPRNGPAKGERVRPIVFTGRDGAYLPFIHGEEIGSILLVKVDHVGDFALALDAFHLLRRTFPAAKITLLCAPWNVSLARASGLFDEVLKAAFFPPRADAPQVPFSPDSLSEVEGRRFDLAVDLRVDPDTRVILDHVEARLTCGYESDRAQRPLTVSVPRPDPVGAPDLGMHQSLILLRLAHTVAQFFRPSEPVGELMADALTEPCDLDLSFAGGRTLVTLNTSSGRAAKNWPLDRFKQLVRWLVHDMDASVLLIGTKDQQSDAERIIAYCASPHVRSAIGQTTLAQALGLMKRSDLFIGNDSGLTHFAARMDVPTVAIYSGIDPTETWAPRGTDLAVVKAPVSCSPCHILKLEDCRFGHACIRAISVPFVRGVVRNALMRSCPSAAKANKDDGRIAA